MDALIHEHFDHTDKLRYFFAGGGALTHPRAILFRYPEAQITVSEIDPAVTEFAKTQLFVDDKNMDIQRYDTRMVLTRANDDAYDVLITDVFHDVGIPYHLTHRQLRSGRKTVKSTVANSGGHLRKQYITRLNSRT